MIEKSSQDKIYLNKIKKKLDASNIFVFLISPNFISSDACVEEWGYVKKLSENKNIFRIPIILSSCAWKDFLAKDDVKALPEDGHPIDAYSDENKAWVEVYEGIKAIADVSRKNFVAKEDFLNECEVTGFISENNVCLNDIFVFPTLKSYTLNAEETSLEHNIKNAEEILDKKYVLIHGDQESGKTALCKYLFLLLVNKKPVLFINLQNIEKRIPNENIFSEVYENQFEGDYNIWKEQKNKTIIFDNLSNSRHSLEHVTLAMKSFDRIILTTSADMFRAYFRDEKRLAKFYEIKIDYLSHVKQEELIKKRLKVSNTQQNYVHGKIDEIERNINAIIINNKFLPRYPFYILSILQTYEGYMPENLEMTSYGHCYYALILSHLIKSGIEKLDASINSCFNFAEYLAFELYNNKRNKSKINFKNFISDYKKKFLIQENLINRLQDSNYGIIKDDGEFKNNYMYFFFLGKFFAKNSKLHKKLIEDISEKSYLQSNSFILLFIIHHTNDNDVIEDILIRTMLTFGDNQPATLDNRETKIFEGLINAIPDDILSESSIEEKRIEEREKRDRVEKQSNNYNPDDEDDNIEYVNDIYKILKNNKVLGQILKNKFGSLVQTRLLEIIETIADSGLRLVGLMNLNQDEINDLAIYLNKQYPQSNVDEIKIFVRYLLFLWTMDNIEKIVATLNNPNTDFSSLVIQLVKEKSTPAYDLIGYFSQLDSIKKFDKEEKNYLENLLKEYKDNNFIKKVLSIRTQNYLNTHQTKAPIEQATCSLLKIQYKPRPYSKK